MENGLELAGVDPKLQDLGFHQCPVIDRDDHLLRGDTHFLEENGADGQHLRIGFAGIDADQVDIPLEELTCAAFLRAFVAPERSKGPPAEGKDQLILTGCDHPRQAGGQFWS